MSAASSVDLVQAALGTVFGLDAVSVLRTDSPLTAVGCTDADMVCIADAIAVGAAEAGVRCVLDDSELVDVITVADLRAAVQRSLDGQSLDGGLAFDHEVR